MRRLLRALLVEDSDDDALLLIEALRRDGYEPEFERVQTAVAMRAALKAQQWEIILCDYIMPGFDATAALRIAQEFNPELPVIVVSGTVGEDTAVATVKLGAADYLMKDRLARLGSAVAQALEQKQLRRERKHSEAARRESEQKFTIAFHEAPVWIVISDVTNDVCLEVNDAALQASGFSREEVIGHTGVELGWIKAEERALLVKKLRQEGRVADFEMRFRAKDGRELWGSVSCGPIIIGGRQCSLSVTIDITARKRAEAALKESEAQLHSILGVAPIGVSRIVDRVILEANVAMIQMLGYSREELYGKPTRILYATDEEYDAVGRQYANMAVQNKASFETRFLAKDGRSIDVAVNAVWLDPANPSAGAVIAVMDIGERKRAVQALSESEEKFAKAFRGSSYSLSISDLATGRYLDVNSGFEQVSGYSRAEAIGRTSNELGFWINPNDRDELIRRLSESGSVRKMEVNFRAKGGRIVTALCNGDLIEVAGSRCILSTFEDMTDRRRAEAEKAGLEAQLKQSQKLEALGTLSGGIAHDFNNILSAMIVYRELAVMDIDRPAELRQHLAEIGAASNRAKDLVRQILTFSRQQQQERRPVQLHPVVREALQLLRASLPSTLEIIQVIDEQAPVVLADTSQVHQIIMNLGTNAAHAMRNRPGQLKVTLNHRLVDEAQARLQHGLRPGSYVRLAIADTGHGMDESTLARIFEPFFTTKGPGEGTGLGLSVVHGIMENHDGVITVDSRAGEGTMFELYFPECARLMAASAEPDDRSPRGLGESVLLVDDEKPLSEAMRNTLQRLGYRVTACTDPLDALRRFRAAPQAFDLLITDQTMPHMTGLEVIQEVHRIRKNLPVVLISGLSGTWTRDKLRGYKIGELVAKPLDFCGLAQAVRRTLDDSLIPVTKHE